LGTHKAGALYDTYEPEKANRYGTVLILYMRQNMEVV